MVYRITFAGQHKERGEDLRSERLVKTVRIDRSSDPELPVGTKAAARVYQDVVILEARDFRHCVTITCGITARAWYLNNYFLLNNKC